MDSDGCPYPQNVPPQMKYYFEKWTSFAKEHGAADSREGFDKAFDEFDRQFFAQNLKAIDMTMPVECRKKEAVWKMK